MKYDESSYLGKNIVIYTINIRCNEEIKHIYQNIVKLQFGIE